MNILKRWAADAGWWLVRKSMDDPVHLGSIELLWQLDHMDDSHAKMRKAHAAEVDWRNLRTKYFRDGESPHRIIGGEPRPVIVHQLAPRCSRCGCALAVDPDQQHRFAIMPCGVCFPDVDPSPLVSS